MSDSPAVRVVIADDEAIIRLDLKEILEDAGYEVVAETGRSSGSSSGGGPACLARGRTGTGDGRGSALGR